MAARRILGLFMLLIGITGVVLSVVATINGRQLIADIAAGIDQSLALTAESLVTVSQTLSVTRTTVGQINSGLTTVEQAADNMGQTLSDTRPLLGQIVQVTSHDVPDSIEHVQDTIPDVAEVAAAVDATLRRLNSFSIDQTILGIPFRYDLGINYAPEQPFDQSVNQIGSSLDGLPQRLRALEIYINVTDNNLGQVSSNLHSIADELGTLNGSIAEVEPLLDDYSRIVGEASVNVGHSRVNLQQRFDSVELILTLVFIWLGLTQLAPIYLGWELFTGRRSPVVEVKESG